MNWKHDDLAADLAKHLNNSARMVWTDMQMGPSGSPRPDVYTMEKSYNRPRPVSYEIKVSRSDFLSDVNAAKWQKYLDFSGGVVFAVPHGLITKKEVPFECGLIVRNENGWKTLKREKPGTGRPDFKAMMKMVIDGVDRVHSAPLPVELREIDAYKAQKSLKRDLGKDIAQMVGSSLMAKERAEYWERRAKDSADHFRQLESQAREHGKKSAESSIAHREKQLKEAQVSITQALGLPEDAGAYAIRAKVAKLVEVLHRDQAIEALQSRLEAYRKIIRNAANSADHLSEPEQLMAEFPADLSDLFREDAA